MKTSLKTKLNRGGALLVTVIVLAVAALYASTYLMMVATERNSVARSQQWNSSLTVAEAGVEEGLAMVNQYAYSTSSISNWVQSATSEGWTNINNYTSGTNTFQVYALSRALPSDYGSYQVYVTNVINGAYPYGLPVILSIGTATNTFNPPVHRQVLVQTYAFEQAGSGGVAAQDGVSTKGNVVIDSWNSADPNHSIWQSNAIFRANYFNPGGTMYGTWTNTLNTVSNIFPSRTADVYVFTDSNVLTLSGKPTIAGYLQTGPNASLSGNGNPTVGDLAWCFGGGHSGTTEPGHYEQDANMNFHSYALPIPTNYANGWMNWSNVPTPPNNAVINIGGMWWKTNGVWGVLGGTLYTNTGGGFNIGGTAYSLVITNRLEDTNTVYYSMGSLSQSIFVDAQYVVLYLTNGLNYSSKTVFTINTNADIKIITTGDISVSGQGVINNMGNYTHAFTIQDVIGYPVSVTLTGNGSASGSYFLPSSTLHFSGGGNSGDFVGAVVCYNIDDTGGMNIHFDQSLGQQSIPPDQFTPSSWTEIGPSD